MLTACLTGLFWLCLGLLFYTYVGYPALVWITSRVRPMPVQRRNIEPPVTLIIAAYNEEKVILAKLHNCFALDYPRHLLQIIVVADGSTDRTPDIARQFADRGVQVLHSPGRRGKSAALNRGAEVASGDVLLFSDANTVYAPDVVQKLARNFAEPVVGGVSGRKILLKEAGRFAEQGEIAFWAYETRLKAAESLIGSIAGADGEIFAVRRTLYEPLPPSVVHDDMYLTLKLLEKGYRVVYESEATSGEHASWNLRDEFHLKVRYAAAGYQIVSLFRRFLWRSAIGFGWQFFSHKVLRWLVPFFLLGLLMSSALLPGPLYRLMLILQLLFYAVALLGLLHPSGRVGALCYFPLYFVFGNAAAAYGFVRYFFAGQSTLWRKAAR